MKLLHATQQVQRISRIPDGATNQNTAEHTFELVMLAWYIVSSQKLDFDMDKILKYALAHDLIEAYSGDTPVFDTEGQKTKASREAAALVRIENEFTEFPELTEIIHEYEKRETPESVFIYALDKLVDPLNASMETTQSIWKDYNMTYAQTREYKDGKIALSPEVQVFWEALTKKLLDKKDFFFHE